MGDIVAENFANSTSREYLSTALQSLDSLSEEILPFLFNTSSPGNNFKKSDFDNPLLKSINLSTLQQDTVCASLTLMHNLLMDAQLKFKKIVDKNQRLMAHVDDAIQSANQEVNSLRLELSMTNQKLSKLSAGSDACSDCHGIKELNKTLEENKSLAVQNRQLLKEMENLREQIASSENRNKDLVHSFERERQRLKQDKSYLLNQVDEMQKSLDDKEEQLRDFIREFELQMKENEDMLKEADMERDRLSRERNDFCRRQQDLADVVGSQRVELVTSERKIKEMESELNLLRQTAAQAPNPKRRSLHVTLDESLSTYRGNAVPPAPGIDFNASLSATESAPSPSLTRACLALSTAGHQSSSSEDLQADASVANGGSLGTSYVRKKKFVQQLSGSLSRALRLGKNRKSLDISRNHWLSLPRNPSFSVSSYSSDADVMLTSSQHNLFERSQEEKNAALDEIKSICMERWRADGVLAWLELIMHMELYLLPCAENVKSGKVMLGLTEPELESCLSIDNPLHRRKLSLAIEEFQNPSVTITTMSPAGHLDHWWVSEQWLIDVGLTQYASRFREHLIDGRTLASLTRRDLERYLGMEGKKQHQESALRGVQLLRMMEFNLERLNERRHMCQSSDGDILVWNNNRFIQWIKSIDLKEYSTNIRDSGLHGALLVLDPHFTPDNVANALGIPINKATVRRHLAAELDPLLAHARESLDDDVIFEVEECGGRKSSHFIRTSSQRNKRSIRSSISRGLGRQLSKDSPLNGK